MIRLELREPNRHSTAARQPEIYTRRSLLRVTAKRKTLSLRTRSILIIARTTTQRTTLKSTKRSVLSRKREPERNSYPPRNLRRRKTKNQRSLTKRETIQTAKVSAL